MPGRTGLVFLRTSDPLGKLRHAAARCDRRLYVILPQVLPISMTTLQERLASAYHVISNSNPRVDARVLLHQPSSPPLDVSVLFGYKGEDDAAKSFGVEFVELETGGGETLKAGEGAAMQQYPKVCMGGTFDRLHIGQKLLLSLAAASVSDNGLLFCGVASTALFKEKVLRELIEPHSRRANEVHKFLHSVRPEVKYEVGILNDGYGPSVHDKDFKAIVVSRETLAGGKKCNEVRESKGMTPMDIVVIELVAPDGALTENLEHDKKLSSSGARKDMLGKVLDGGKLWCRRAPVDRPYLIGLVGPKHAGKTTVKELLGDLGATTLEVGGEATAKDIIAKATEGKVAVIEAHELTKGLRRACDEVWLVVAPPKVIKERCADGADSTEEHDSLEMVGKAHVLISNHASKEELQRVVRSAWDAMQPRTTVTLANLDGVAAQWAELTARHCVSAEGASSWWRTLRDLYSEQHRAYHTLAHINEMLTWHSETKGMMQEPDEVAFAIFFHDAVYDPTAPAAQNEKDSAEMWKEFAAEHLAGSPALKQRGVERVYDYIVRTATHMDGPAEGDLAIFLDIDLAVLGSAPHRYAEYCEDIRTEYCFVPYSVYCSKRPAAIAKFAEGDGPYFTPFMKEKLGRQAVSNVRREVEMLTKAAQQ